MKLLTYADLIQIDSYTYEVPTSYRSDMRVPARVFADKKLLGDILQDRSLWQLINVATLPGIVQSAYAMPDAHEGYGFPIGGVAAYAIDEGGVISPGGIGYDINCGVRLLVSNMPYQEIEKYMEKLAHELSRKIPSGVGRGGRLKVSDQDLENVLQKGAHAMLEFGYGVPDDIEHCEEQGHLEGADPKLVSSRAKKRGFDQLGTLGSGNHFIEIQLVDQIFNEGIARAYNIKLNDVAVMIHCGSRGLGHQVCTDYIRSMLGELDKLNITLADRELVCAPFNSHIAQEYVSAMKAAANFAWANRQMIAHWVREAWQSILGSKADLTLLYDLSHNIGKIEEHVVDGVKKKLVMHRKGATRSFGPGRIEVPSIYRSVGQPVLIPGTMGTASYVLAGTSESMEKSFGSCCHGAGRAMSRSKARNMVRGPHVRKELAARGIIIKSDSNEGLAEEAPLAYKDVNTVVEVVEGAGLAQRVARLKPLAVIKGN